ncbi:hypothetical protein CWB79_21095 [Pseudoalteromonas sp. S1649]|nr:hypothetical protein CWB80_20160 [Pseudoalteromonas sp. S1650]TMP64354.1 hypothetical protein CWB79_21095 [Pseudoalteromonas sp. S1649]
MSSLLLLLLGLCFVMLSLLTFIRWLRIRYDKQHWRVCKIVNINNVIDNNVRNLELLHYKRMLVSYKFKGNFYSVFVAFDQQLIAKFKNGIDCTILIDSNNPNVTYLNSNCWVKYCGVWLFSGIIFIASSFLTSN